MQFFTFTRVIVLSKVVCSQLFFIYYKIRTPKQLKLKLKLKKTFLLLLLKHWNCLWYMY